MSGSKALGFKFKIGNWRFRVWKKGFEYGNQFGGKVIFFPWSNVK